MHKKQACNVHFYNTSEVNEGLTMVNESGCYVSWHVLEKFVKVPFLASNENCHWFKLIRGTVLHIKGGGLCFARSQKLGPKKLKHSIKEILAQKPRTDYNTDTRIHFWANMTKDNFFFFAKTQGSCSKQT